MREVVLLQKTYRGICLSKVEKDLGRLCEGLRVRLVVLGAVENGWIKVGISGEDEKVAVHFLEKEVGLAPISSEKVENFSVMHGRIILSGRNRGGVLVDIGVFLPKPMYAFVSLRRLQGQLIDRKKFALSRIVKLFGLMNGFPLELFIVEVDGDVFKAALEESQLELYGRWIGSRLDRLFILGAFYKSAKRAIRKAGLTRDVLKVEPMGVLEHAMVCKLGTDASGLVPKLGRFMPRAEFICFSPRQVLEFAGGRW